MPGFRLLRWIGGVLLVIGGLFGFLPILGFWMIPLGLGLLAPDVPPLRRLMARFGGTGDRDVDDEGETFAEGIDVLPADSRWTREELIHDGDAYFDRMIAEIEAARESVLLEMYIFEDDALGRRLAGALEDAARRGVSVRVMVDGIGSPGWSDRFERSLRQAGARTRVYNPRPWSLIPAIVRSLGRPGWPREIIARLNRRNHRKVTIIDGGAAWLGSLNVSARILASTAGPAAWHECGVRLEGPEVAVLTAAFRYSWDRVATPFARLVDPERHRRRVALIEAARHARVNVPRIMRTRHHRDLLRRIRGARRRLWIETPYFVPTRRLLNALRLAARRGVDLRLLLPARPDHAFMTWVRAPFCRTLIKAGVRIVEYQPSVLHAKFMIIDDLPLIGSSNLNFRSILHDLEVDVFLCSAASRVDLEERFARDEARSVEVTLDRFAKRSVASRLIGGLLFRLRYWM